MMNRERFSRRAPAWGGAYDASLMARRQPVARMPGDFVMRLSSADIHDGGKGTSLGALLHDSRTVTNGAVSPIEGTCMTSLFPFWALWSFVLQFHASPTKPCGSLIDIPGQPVAVALCTDNGKKNKKHER